jgi:hypothetical protein
LLAGDKNNYVYIPRTFSYSSINIDKIIRRFIQTKDGIKIYSNGLFLSSLGSIDSPSIIRLVWPLALTRHLIGACLPKCISITPRLLIIMYSSLSQILLLHQSSIVLIHIYIYIKPGQQIYLLCVFLFFCNNFKVKVKWKIAQLASEKIQRPSRCTNN